ncbi:hypothetical protein AB0G02_18820 [Actinosynnema sp. NPDC023658]|uniref:hypothetical protein n=1 Tax=Actinosynnema sp. NPDC023658 TaxID=3155465 RepID=UPI0033E2A533
MGAGSANAYSGPIYHGNDYAETLGVNDDIIQVCDREADGNGVYAEYYLNNGSYHKRGDSNGSASPCSKDDWTATAYWISRYRVCEDTVGCSSYRYTDGLGGSSVRKG